MKRPSNGNSAAYWQVQVTEEHLSWWQLWSCTFMYYAPSTAPLRRASAGPDGRGFSSTLLLTCAVRHLANGFICPDGSLWQKKHPCFHSFLCIWKGKKNQRKINKQTKNYAHMSMASKCDWITHCWCACHTSGSLSRETKQKPFKLTSRCVIKLVTCVFFDVRIA